MRAGQSAGTGFIGRQNAVIVVVLLIPTAQLLHRSIDVVSSNAAELCLLFIHPPAHGSEVSPAARNTLDSARIPTASKLLICGLFQKGRVLAQDGRDQPGNLWPHIGWGFSR